MTDTTYCKWFALCTNEATDTRRGPTGGGAWGQIPICARCKAKIEKLEEG